MPETLTFTSAGSPCHAWHFRGEGGTFRTTRGVPCIVMAHGFSATADSGLLEYAEALSAAGVDVLAFDYRGFGVGAGRSAAVVSPAEQRQDYRAAISCARSLDGVDPTRIIVWGVSLSGGHVLALAADDPAIAAVMALTPAVDGPAAITSTVRRAPKAAAKLAAAGIGDIVSTLRHSAPVTVPAVGRPGAAAMITAPGAMSGYSAMAGPSAVNVVPARSLFHVAAYRPARQAGAIKVPVLFQIADDDQTAPPSAARKAAFKCRAEVRHYPCAHFDIYPGAAWFDTVVAHQIHFLQRHFVPSSPHAPVVPLEMTS